jgi:nicotinamidase-related amidase
VKCSDRQKCRFQTAIQGGSARSGGGLAQRFRAAGASVVRVRVSFSGDFADAHRPPVDQPTNFASLPAGWDEFPEPLPSSDLVITKRQWGAFYGAELDLQLHRPRRPQKSRDMGMTPRR